MNYTGYDLLWLFFIYSFLGWVLETVTAAAKQKRKNLRCIRGVQVRKVR